MTPNRRRAVVTAFSNLREAAGWHPRAGNIGLFALIFCNKIVVERRIIARDFLVMKKLLLLALSASFFAQTAAQARFGETADQAKERYGNPIAVINKKYCEASDGGAHLYAMNVKSLNGRPEQSFIIHIEYKNGLAWLIRYTTQGLTDADRMDLMNLNQGGVNWSPAIDISGQKRVFWKDLATNSRFATHYRAGAAHMLQIASADCVQALSAQRLQETKLIADMKEWTPLVEEAKPEKPAAPAPAAADGAPAAGPRLPGL